jgi:phosphatidylcholine synthase
VGVAGAWLVHGLTASGAVLALLALVAAAGGRYRAAFFWLAAQVAVDAVDGWLARRARVRERLPFLNGAHLDDIVDYLTYVFVPAFIVVHGGLVPAPLALPVAGAMVLSSAFGFSREDAKTADHFFTGFPSYWNVVVVYFFALQTPPAWNAVLLALLAVMVFVPIRYVYPSRTQPLMGVTVPLGCLWALQMLGIIWLLPSVPRWLALSALVFPAYYVALSVVLDRRRGAADPC